MFRSILDWLSSGAQTTNHKSRNRQFRRQRFRSAMSRAMRVELLEDRRLLIVGAFEVAPIVAPGTGFDGVVAIDFSLTSDAMTISSGCTGSLLTTGRHILTAAHCVTDGSGVRNVNNVAIVFEMPDKNYVIPVDLTLANVLDVHPDWNGSTGDGADIAIIQLPVIAPFPAERYDIYRRTDELGALYVQAGYGRTGVGSLGTDPSGSANLTGAVKRLGQNEFSEIENAANGDILMSDFDDGTAANNVHGTLGLGFSETNGSAGDSGSGAFLFDFTSGKIAIAGIQSFSRDTSGTGRDTFGDEDGLTRVSDFIGYVDGVLADPAGIVLDMNFQPMGNNGVPDHINLRLDPDDNTRVQILTGEQEIWSDLFTRVTSFTILGSGDDDILTVDFRNGNPIPAGGLDFDGRSPGASDTFVVVGTSGPDVFDVTIVDNNSATVNVNNGPDINVDNVELTIYDGGGGGDDVTIVGTGGVAVDYLHTPGTATDAGRVDSEQDGVIGAPFVPLEYLNLGDGTLTLVVNGNGDVTVLGTALNDVFVIQELVGDQARITHTVEPFLGFARVPIVVDNLGTFTAVIVDGLAGDDEITWNLGPDGEPNQFVTARGGSGNDVFTIVGAAGVDDDITLSPGLPGDPGGYVITRGGFSIASGDGYTGVEVVRVVGNFGDDDTLTVNGTAEDDTITYRPTGVNTGEFSFAGGSTLFRFDVPGDFTINGQGGVADRVILVGTNNHDVFTIDSPARTAVVQNAASVDLKQVTLGFTVEVLTAQGRLGNDTFIVIPAPAFGAGLLVDIDGGSPLASDALLITDLDGNNDPVPLADTDFVVVGKSRVPDAGNVTVYRNAVRMPSISYENVEILWVNIDPVDPHTGDPNLLVIGPDRFEPNDFRATAAFLGSGSEITVQNLAIFPNSSEHIGVPADQDWFRVVAQRTGTLDFQVYHRTFDDTLLPAGGNLDIQVTDAAGNVISGFGTNDDDDDERVRIPVVAGRTYYLRVFGAADAVINGYDLTIVNTAPPVPYDLELDDLIVNPTPNPPGQGDNSDTGRSQFDNVTYDNTPTIRFRLDDAIFLHDLPGNPVPGNPPDEVIPIPFNPEQADAPTTAGYRVAIFVEGDPQQPGQLPQVPVGYARQIVEGVYEFDFETDALAAPFVLSDGSHFISARVQMIDPATATQTGFGGRSASLEIIVDITPPPIAFGLPGVVGDGLHPDSDSGVAGPNNQATLSDRVTNDAQPTFWGRAEANAIVRAYLDVNRDGAVDDGDIFIGMTVAVPLDGSNQFPHGHWELTSVVDMNDPAARDLAGNLSPLPLDGLRRILVTAEDLAGNLSEAEELDIFIDTQGPQITAVYITSAPDYDLFDVKPTQGPTPLVHSLTIDVRDLPARVAPEFLYAALAAGTNGNPAENPGHYQVIGDHNGIIVITDVQFIPDPDPAVDGEPATGRIVLTFAEPLPDDRFTLIVSDAVVDPAGNALDGESNASEPNGGPQFPSGDGQPGGNFVARFTVDSRAEVGVWSGGSVYVDSNGNYVWDPEGKDGDFVNRDVTYILGYTSDNIFAGNFAAPDVEIADAMKVGDIVTVQTALPHVLSPSQRVLIQIEGEPDQLVVVATVLDATTFTYVEPAAAPVPAAGDLVVPVADGFDKLAAYGKLGSNYRWLIDTNNDSVPELVVTNPLALNGLPAAGNFDGNLTKGDQVVLKVGTTWYIDWNRDFMLDDAEKLVGNLVGYPVVGDFDGDGLADLGAWADDTFSLNLSSLGPIDGFADVQFRFGISSAFIGVLERPIAADFDGDGIDDLGLWVPKHSGGTPLAMSEWYILVSDNRSILDRIRDNPQGGLPIVDFVPTPFGKDLFKVFGSDYALPVVGNFDPHDIQLPPSGVVYGLTNLDNPYDVNGDGSVTPLDALLLVNEYNLNGPRTLTRGILGGPFWDVTEDGRFTPNDVLAVVNELNRQAGGAAEGEGGTEAPGLLFPWEAAGAKLVQSPPSLELPGEIGRLAPAQVDRFFAPVASPAEQSWARGGLAKTPAASVWDDVASLELEDLLSEIPAASAGM